MGELNFYEILIGKLRIERRKKLRISRYESKMEYYELTLEAALVLATQEYERQQIKVNK